jgi:excisionase family DNA binding protein
VNAPRRDMSSAVDVEMLRARLGAALAPGLVDAIEQLVIETVRAELAAGPTAGGAASPWLSIGEAAEYLRVSERKLHRLIAGDRVRSTTLGRRRLLHRDDVDALLDSGDGGGRSANHVTPSPRGVE